MPIVIEEVVHPSEQDKKDLKKIFDEFPDERGRKIISDPLVDDKTGIIAGRFNGRLLGVLCFNAHDEVTYLCTRKVTRNRHVAREIIRQALPHHPTLHFRAEDAASPVMQSLLKGLGFIQVDHRWQQAAV